jgi:AAA ATPase domain
LQSAVRQSTIGAVTKLPERKSELAAIRAFARRGGVLVVEGRAGVGKTTILDAACVIARRDGRLVLGARASDLEGAYAFGIVRQLFERRCTEATRSERTALFRGAAGAARALVMGEHTGRAEQDTSFAVVHGLYWLAVNLAALQPVLLAVDDLHWGDDGSLRCLAHLAAGLDGTGVSLVVTLRPDEARSRGRALLAVRDAANVTLRPALLSGEAVAAITLRTLGSAAADSNTCAAIYHATGGNPFYVLELLRALNRADRSGGAGAIEDAVSRGGLEGVALQLGARLRNLDLYSLRLAQAIAILGDGCELRHAAAISQTEMAQAIGLATELVRLDVLGEDQPPRFIHPIVQHALVQTLSRAEHDAAHRAAARVLHSERSPPGRIAPHVMRLSASGDPWVVERLREAASEALENGAPATAADLLERALAEPPTVEPRSASKCCVKRRGRICRLGGRSHANGSRKPWRSPKTACGQSPT